MTDEKRGRRAIRAAVEFALVAAVVGGLLSLFFWAHGPDTYDECILEHLDSGMSNLVANEVIASCERQFGPPNNLVTSP